MSLKRLFIPSTLSCVIISALAADVCENEHGCIEPEAAVGNQLMQTGKMTKAMMHSSAPEELFVGDQLSESLDSELLREDSAEESPLRAFQSLSESPEEQTKMAGGANSLKTVLTSQTFMSYLPNVFVFAALIIVLHIVRRLKYHRSENEKDLIVEETRAQAFTSKLIIKKREERDAFGCTELHIAAHKGEEIRVQELLQQRSDPNAREAWDDTPLHMAARAGHCQVCVELIKAGADINAVNADDKTPLYVAGESKQEKICDVLLDLDAHCGNVSAEELPATLSMAIFQRLLRDAPVRKAAHDDDASS
eukprot:TRINITY_DN42416_c0_g1_i1.p1 TRINITY_DN42416_c0_g1~~TRINITY_DN42416_c0_g1_i1.p1  ORF type:complete len:308 (+),score=81.52 TRINITY_DN42416_c0_g1_i1:218-1141(+)